MSSVAQFPFRWVALQVIRPAQSPDGWSMLLVDDGQAPHPTRSARTGVRCRSWANVGPHVHADCSCHGLQVPGVPVEVVAFEKTAGPKIPDYVKEDGERAADSGERRSK